MSPKGKGHLKLFFNSNKIQMEFFQIISFLIVILNFAYHIYRLSFVRKLSEDQHNSSIRYHPIKGIIIIKKIDNSSQGGIKKSKVSVDAR